MQATDGRQVSMLRFLVAQFRHRAGRVLAVFLGIAVAAGSFTVLSGAVRSSQAEVRGTVEGSFRSTYDILVRPLHSQTPIERSAGVVRDNYLSGIFGGITIADYRRIARIPGVEVAAPIAMLGYVLQDVRLPIDLTEEVAADRAAGHPRSLFSYQVTRTTDRGLTRYDDEESGYAYVTAQRLKPLRSFAASAQAIGPKEVLPDGRLVRVCPSAFIEHFSSPFDPGLRSSFDCWSERTGLEGFGDHSGSPGRAAVLVDWHFPFLVAAVDPAAEAELTGLGDAMVDGRYLRGADGVTRSDDGSLQVPVIVSTRSFQDDTDHVVVRHLPTAAAEAMVRGLSPAEVDRLVAAGTGPIVVRQRIGPAQAYRRLLASLTSHSRSFVDNYWTVGPTRYRRVPGSGDVTTLAPVPVRNPASVWSSQFQSTGFVLAPTDNQATAFRRLRPHVGSNMGPLRLPLLRALGRFDPNRLAGFDELSQVPMETYNPPTAAPATSRDARLLGGRDLLPNGNLAGYLQAPPLMLTTLDGASAFTDPLVFPHTSHKAPISVIRVRVDGVTGADEASLARIEQVATAIIDRTGLEVDITVGSSPTRVKVPLPGEPGGRPPLALIEGWTEKGVAVAILSAVDRKSLLLFVLVFVVCALFVANAAAASVRVRRFELGMLACVGWDPRKLFTGVLAELVVIGAIAGSAGAALGWGVAGLVGVDPSPLLAALVIPASVLLSALAGLTPALRAAHSAPADAVRPAVRDPRPRRRGPRPPRGVAGLAAGNLSRSPGRTVAAAAALAVGVAALTALLTITSMFRGAVVGTLLGSAVVVDVRGVDYVAVAVLLVLGAVAVADVVYLGLRERATELATLTAVGWRDGTLSRMVATEGVLLGLIGSVAGAVAGSALGVLLDGGFADVAAVGVAAVGIGVVAAGLATLAPAQLVRRLPTNVLLAEE